MKRRVSNSGYSSSLSHSRHSINGGLSKNKNPSQTQKRLIITINASSGHYDDWGDMGISLTIFCLLQPLYGPDGQNSLYEYNGQRNKVIGSVTQIAGLQNSSKSPSSLDEKMRNYLGIQPTMDA